MLRIFDMSAGEVETDLLSTPISTQVDGLCEPANLDHRLQLRLLSVAEAESEQNRPQPRPRPWVF